MLDPYMQREARLSLSERYAQKLRGKIIKTAGFKSGLKFLRISSSRISVNVSSCYEAEISLSLNR